MIANSGPFTLKWTLLPRKMSGSLASKCSTVFSLCAVWQWTVITERISQQSATAGNKVHESDKSTNQTIKVVGYKTVVIILWFLKNEHQKLHLSHLLSSIVDITRQV